MNFNLTNPASCSTSLASPPDFSFSKPSCGPVFWQDIIDKPTLFPYDFNVQDSSNINLTFTLATNTLTADLINTTVTAGSYGSATQVGTFTVDAKGRLTAAANVSISYPIVSVADTNSVDLTLAATVLTADVRISAAASDAGNQRVSIDIQADGLRAYFATLDSNSIDFTPATSVGGNFTADLKISAASPPAGNTQITNVIEADGLLSYIANTALDGFYWKLTGNSGTSAGTNFIGTTDAQSVVVKSNSTEVARFNTSFNFLVGTAADQGYREAVFSDGTVLNGVIVQGGNASASNFIAKYQNSAGASGVAFFIQNDLRASFLTATPTANATLTVRQFSATGSHKVMSFQDETGTERGYVRATSGVASIFVDSISAFSTMLTLGQQGVTVVNVNTNGSTGTNNYIRLTNTSSITSASGIQRHVYVSGSFEPASGTSTFDEMHFDFTINQTGGANGVTNGINMVPILTAAVEFTAFNYNPTITSVTTHYGVRIRPNTVLNGFGVSTPVATVDIQQGTLGNAVLKYTSAATNDDPGVTIYQNRVATTDATLTTLHTVAIPATTTVLVSGYVTARRTGGAAGTAEDGAAYRIEAVYKNVAGTATLIGGGITAIGEDQAAWDAQLNVSGANVLIQILGAVNNNVSWHLSELKLMSVSS